MLKRFTSNHYERLEQRLVDALSRPTASALIPQVVIIPSTAIKRSVEIALANRIGVCANLRFDFLGQWLWKTLSKVIHVAEQSPFSPTLLRWRIYALLTDTIWVSEHPKLLRYLAKADNLMRYELAHHCATLFDQYLTYRSDWLEIWLKPGQTIDEDEAWQASLWRRIAQDLGAQAQHPSVAFFKALEARGDEVFMENQMRVSVEVFCLPSIPGLYLQMLKRLAGWIDINLYSVNPCAEYWYEVINPKRLGRLKLASKSQYHEIGNRLLASWGQQSKEHFSALMDDDFESIESSDFENEAPTTLLKKIQNAVLHLNDPDPGSWVLEHDDRSLEVHVCHSLVRELEVLLDQLLAMFSSTEALRPSDVLVVTPDLEAAAPLIEAVFGKGEDSPIPYVITGRSDKALNPYAQTLLALFRFANSRFEADRFLELLQMPLVARRFGLDDEAIARIRHWLEHSGVRWAIDGEHRMQLGLPPFESRSFRDGFDRLFLGYAMPAWDSTPVEGRLAAGNPSGLEAQTLGRLKLAFDALKQLHRALAEDQTPEPWCQLYLATLASFGHSDAAEQLQFKQAASVIHALRHELESADVCQPLAFELIQKRLEERFAEVGRGAVPSGVLSFTSMSGLRYLPYRMICVIGLGDEAFPSKHRPLEFDLMAKRPRQGDRLRRLDDRSLFLDLVIASRERLYLSYTGRSIRDHAPLAPSILLSELLDYAASAIAQMPLSAESLQAARSRLVIEHPLQAFSLSYFLRSTEPRRRSVQAVYRNAHAQSLMQDHDQARPKPFFMAPLPKPSETFHRLSLADLSAFFSNPSRYLLLRRLGLALGDEEAALESHEPFRADKRSRRAFASRMLPALMRGESPKQIRDRALAGLEYPPGRLGDIARDEELAALQAFAQSLPAALKDPPLGRSTSTIDIEIEGSRWQLSHTWSELRADGLVRYRYGEVHVFDYLRGWLEQLMLNAVAFDTHVRRQLLWYSLDGHYALDALDDARLHLQKLLHLYAEGLCQPLHFYPQSAWRYMIEGGNLSAARKTWDPNDAYALGEGEDPAYRLALRGVDEPLDQAFEANARAVFEPMLKSLRDERLA
ncbi:MAG: exodeoxyribonuclease V subunit gamma [Betaproteobacteria bacterium]|nr:exodeoxyribonuclease V subunit gamma [Betaproteobacteria bacterium]